MNKKLTNQQVRDIRSSGLSSSKLALQYGITKPALRNIRVGNRYSNVGMVGQKKGDYDYDYNIPANDIKTIKRFLERGYLNYGQIAKYFKVSVKTIYNLNTYGSRVMGRKRKYNQITYTYFKVLYEELGSYQKVADKVGAKEKNVYRLLTGYRT